MAEQEIQLAIHRLWEELKNNENLWEEFVTRMLNEDLRNSYVFDGLLQLHSLGVMAQLLQSAMTGSSSKVRKEACLLLNQICSVNLFPDYADMGEELLDYFKRAAMALLESEQEEAKLCGITTVAVLLEKTLDSNVFWEEFFNYVSAALCRSDSEQFLDAIGSVLMRTPYHFEEFVFVYIGRCHYEYQERFVERMKVILGNGRWPFTFMILIHLLHFTTYDETETILIAATSTEMFEREDISFANKRMVVEILIKCLDTHEVWPSFAIRMAGIASTLVQSPDLFPLGSRICEVLVGRFVRSFRRR